MFSVLLIKTVLNYSFESISKLCNVYDWDLEIFSHKWISASDGHLLNTFMCYLTSVNWSLMSFKNVLSQVLF